AGTVGKHGREAPRSRLRRLPPETVDRLLDDHGALLVTAPVRREAVEADRMAEHGGAGSAVRERPAERIETARDDRHALLESDHHRAGVGGPRIAETLPGAFHEHPDDVALPGQPARDADRVAVPLAPPHREGARP